MDGALDSNVLVLNRLWQAVNICSARRAFSLLYCGQAQVVHHDEGNYHTFDFNQWSDANRDYGGEDSVSTVACKVRVPKIILLMIFDRLPRKEVKLTRQNVFERDGFVCQYCYKKFERSQLNIDHVLPRQRDGKTTWENVVTSCVPCNTKKGNRLPHEANMRLLKEPVKPKLRPCLHVSMPRLSHDSWRHFVDPRLWKVQISD